MNPNPNVPAAPHSTYRVQFNPDFRFVDGTQIVPYLDELGVGYLYASPYFRARPGSRHGYDVVDHNQLNPEIGDDREHRAMIEALQRRGMGHLLDFVPNHMGIGSDNPWWLDVLALGRLSQYANFFDIDWHPSSAGRGKVVLPMLGDHYGRVVERGELTVAFDAANGTFALRYFEHVFPLAPWTYAQILEFAASAAPAETGSTLRTLAADFFALRSRPRDARRRAVLREQITAGQRALAQRVANEPVLADAIGAACATFGTQGDRLDALVDAQSYRPAFWRVAADEINYRRFFDINDLAGLRVEDAEVLARTHQLVFRMIEDGRIQGLRIDHVDGLANPGGYCNLLVDRAAALGQPLYVVVEKILLEGERLRASWRIAGTTGYDFTNLLLGLFVDRAAERVFDRIYRRATARTTRFADEADAAKSRIMRLDLASELHVLADALTRIARSDRRSRDFTTTGLRNALAEVIRALPVYRTYVVDERIELEDRLVIENAVSEAAARTESPDEGIFSFIRDALSAQLHLLPGARYDRTAVIRFAMRFQQYTGPVTAKSVEDTAFYRYARLVALNEVGGEPARFGRSVAEFHAANVERARLYPHSLLATATHDTKRGEDTRLRIAALSEFPAPWSRAIVRWGRLNAAARSPELDAPIPVDELLFYQTVLGTLPPAWLEDEPLDTGAHAAYVERLVAYARKAAREAKLRTSWTDPHQGYEAALEAFVRSTLQADGPFFREACALARLLAPVAAVHGLAQVVLKLTAPGVPDIYQGCELWDFSLVDPDNRRPVDYAYRAALLADFAAREDAEAFAAELLGSWTDGRIKLYLTWKLLRLRRERVATFMGPDYRELRIDGDEADAIVAFARGPVAVIAPRLVRSRLENGTLRVRYPACRLRLETPLGAYRNVLDGRSIHADRTGAISIDDALAILPVAVLVPA